MTSFTATYSPEDNKLRLYASARLPDDLYQRVSAAGFRWAPLQKLFFATWSPAAEDLCFDLAGDVGDDDTSLVDRAEERAGRFEGYSENRERDAENARQAVKAIADHIPFGQPILVGHHSEARARRDAKKIENGMRKAVRMWETAEYWERRAAGAIRHAKYKERPDVRARRIKKLEAEKRKVERNRQEAEMWLKLWNDCAAETDKELQAQVALKIAGMCWLRLPRKEGDRPDFDQCPSAYDALTNSHPSLYAPRTLSEVLETAARVYPASIAHYDRWIAHYENRLAYERAMLADQGGTLADRNKPEVGGAVRCWVKNGTWLEVHKVNKVSVTVMDSWGEGREFSRTVRFDELRGVKTRAEWQAMKAGGEVAATPTERAEGWQHRAHGQNANLHLEAAEQQLNRQICRNIEKPKAEDFEAMKARLKAGFQVQAVPQLFPTPRELAERMGKLADIRPGHRVLEPNAGTGAIIGAMGCVWYADGGELVAVEINRGLAERLEVNYPITKVVNADFLQCNGDLGQFDRILMNPPFQNGQDIKHIEHALHMLKPGGRLVAVCANGPRQREKLLPLVEQCGGTWEDLPPGTFKESGTMVNSALLVIER